MPSIPKFAPTEAGWRLEDTYGQLPGMFYERVLPVAVGAPEMVLFNGALAGELGLGAEVLEGDVEVFAGNRLPEGSAPLAQAYAGHQYGHFTVLGDGRAVLLGEQITPGGGRFDVQLKGSGPTPFSRRGDGRAALGSMLREYIISEAMHGLGVPTTRSLAVVATGEAVYREEVLPGAVLTRVAASHIRVGTFEWAAARGDVGAVRALADYTLARHYPEVAGRAAPYVGFLEAVVERQAALVAKWLHVGFVHGVMNTDNMALSGETIDYGPCAFMDGYDPATVFSSIDRHGRYAYGNQPQIAQWNLARLAEALLPLLDSDEKRAVEVASEVVRGFEGGYRRHWLGGMRAKLGLFGEEEWDAELAGSLLEWMRGRGADYTNTFRDLSREGMGEGAAAGDSEYRGWWERWKARLGRQAQGEEEVRELMRSCNPAYIPRNHRVEEALEAATERGDLSVLRRLLSVLERPYDHGRKDPEFGEPPVDGGRGYRTYCGT